MDVFILLIGGDGSVFNSVHASPESAKKQARCIERISPKPIMDMEQIECSVGIYSERRVENAWGCRHMYRIVREVNLYTVIIL